MKPVFIIAEAGSCHAGSLDNAKRLIDLAYRVGADACKFQFCSDLFKLAAKRGVAKIKYPFSIDFDWIPELARRCGDPSIGFEFMCTTYLMEDIPVIAPYVKRFKVSAFEADAVSFVGAHIAYGKPILVSNYPFQFDTPDCIERLYCVSKYPCPDNELKLRNFFHHGLSDHTRNPLSGALAVALGAEYIETHFRLDDTPPDCPDYCVARSPTELVEYIKNIRQAEVLLGR